jgi:hypothetical protein
MSLEIQYIESQYCVTNFDNHWWVGRKKMKGEVRCNEKAGG